MTRREGKGAAKGGDVPLPATLLSTFGPASAGVAMVKKTSVPRGTTQVAGKIALTMFVKHFTVSSVAESTREARKLHRFCEKQWTAAAISIVNEALPYGAW